VTRAEVVIVGAGVVGASAAWHLCSRGARSVLLLDRGSAPAQGSTGRATGGFRAQFGTEVNVRLSLLAREALRRFRDELGVDPGYRPCGYLWLTRSAAQRAQLEQSQRLQHALGLTEARMVSAAEAQRLNPALREGEHDGGAFCPTDGFLRPGEILRGYLEGAERLGARVRWSSEVVGLRRGAHGRIEAVQTRDDEIAAGAVVDAAGAWAAGVARLAGASLPVAPLRRQVASTAPTSALPDDMPMTLFVEDGFHLRVRDGRVLLLQPTPPDPADPFSTQLEPAFLDAMAAMAARRVPPLAGVPLDPSRSWAGLYEMSPDKHALLGALPGCPNLWLANGSSGHGVMHSPALGRLLAELMLDGRASSMDVHALRPTRFDEGRPNPVSELL
jgi:sarcosine oxidase subunit beta